MELLYNDITKEWEPAPEHLVQIYFESKAAADKCIENLRNLKRYRWHDLRKDPNDLPTVGNIVIFATKDGCVQEGTFNRDYWFQFRWSAKRWEREVIAWREKEPFEPEERCPNDYHGGDV